MIALHPNSTNKDKGATSLAVFMICVLVATISAPRSQAARSSGAMDDPASGASRGAIRVAQASDGWYRIEPCDLNTRNLLVHADADAIYTLSVDKVSQLVKWSLDGDEIWRRSGLTGVESHGQALTGDGINIYTLARDTAPGPATNLTLAKWDGAGAMIWYKTWGFNGTTICSLWANGTDVFGCGTSDPYAGDDVAVVKWDAASGALEWNKTWTGGGIDAGNGIFVVNASVYVCGQVGMDALLLRLDATDGSFVWNGSWSRDANLDIATSIWSGDGKIYTAVTTYGESSPRYMGVVEWNLAGNVGWYQSVGNPSATASGSGIWSDASAVYACGSVHDGDRTTMILVKWLLDGTLAWSRTWGGESFSAASCVGGNGDGIYVGGVTYTSYPYQKHLALVKWTRDGTTVPLVTFSLSPYDVGLFGADISLSVVLATIGLLAITGKAFRRAKRGVFSLVASLAGSANLVMAFPVSSIIGIPIYTVAVLPIAMAFGIAGFAAGKLGARRDEDPRIAKVGSVVGILTMALSGAGLVLLFILTA
ncbi:MAG: hypothetical protein JW839_14350 [Candidatus Lokiarchaeota archaeon]|nr:hypothetical protein [Candidatus Lokiarchaeota archaeon]